MIEDARPTFPPVVVQMLRLLLATVLVTLCSLT